MQAFQATDKADRLRQGCSQAFQRCKQRRYASSHRQGQEVVLILLYSYERMPPEYALRSTAILQATKEAERPTDPAQVLWYCETSKPDKPQLARLL